LVEEEFLPRTTRTKHAYGDWHLDVYKFKRRTI